MRLRTQLALAIVLTVCTTLAGAFFGIMALGEWHTARLFARLPEKAQRAARDLEAGILPEAEEFYALVEFERPLISTFETTQMLALIGLTLIAAFIGVTTSVIIARRVSAPLEAVAVAARKIATGDLSARAVQPAAPFAGELSQLVRDFNQMALSLQRAERELREGSAAIAHELRTPLTVMRGRLQGMQDGIFEHTEAEIENLIVQTDALSHIVEDLQTVSLAAVGMLSLRQKPTDLAAEISALAEAVTADLNAAGMTIELDLKPAPAIADAPRVRQALFALIDNARRHARCGRVVQLESGVLGEFAYFTVADRGPGIPTGSEHAIFQRFWRADASRSRDSGGAGLGLSVVKAIAAAHGGKAIAENRNGGGLAITISIPGL